MGISAHFENESCCLRPCTPDDIPIIGPLATHKDIYLNVGYAGRGVNVFAGGKAITEMMLDNEVSFMDFPQEKYGPVRFNL